MTTIDHIDSITALEQRFGALKAFDTIIIGVSGGSDSVGLLRMIWRWSQLCHGRVPRLIAATVNHDMRPESATEARQVRDWSLALGFEHRTVVWIGPKPASGLQDAARRARYRLLAALMRRLAGRVVLLTAHTIEDQAETVLMRLARGSGPDGLAAINQTTRLHGCDVVRPTLDLTRPQLRGLLTDQRQSWLDDPSNDSRKFERIRVRQARAARRELGLDDSALARTAKRMARASAALEHIVTEQIEQAVAGNDRLARYGVFVWCEAHGKLQAEIIVRLLRRVVFALGGQAERPGLSKTEALAAELGRPDFSGATLGGCRIARSSLPGAAQIEIFREIGRNPLSTVELVAPESAVWDRRFAVDCRSLEAGNIRVGGCDEAAFGQLATQPGWVCPPGISREILQATPVVWQQDRLIAAPAAGWLQGELKAESSFLVRNLLLSDGNSDGEADLAED